jgi:hypothetical protein
MVNATATTTPKIVTRLFRIFTTSFVSASQVKPAPVTLMYFPDDRNANPTGTLL